MLEHALRRSARENKARVEGLAQSDGSVSEDEADAPLADEDYDSCSDGSAFTMPGGEVCAGAASVHTYKHPFRGKQPGHTVRRKQHLRMDAPWPSASAYLNHNAASPSSFHAEAMGATLAFEGDDYKEYALHHGCKHAMDNMSVLKTLETKARPPTVRNRFRTAGNYLVERMKRAHPSRCETEWVKGHSGDLRHDRADRRAKRASFRPPHDFRRFPDSEFHFHLYFYDCLVEDDVRRHIMDTSREHHLRKLRSTPQGKMNDRAKGKRSMPALTAKAKTRISESFVTRYVAGLLTTPHTEWRMGKADTPRCPLCDSADATMNHIVYHCTHPTLVEARRKLDVEATKLLTPPDLTYAETHAEYEHPARKLDVKNLYPYATDLNRLKMNETPLHISGLPESRWYRQPQPHKVVVHAPHTVGVRPVEISTAEFWKLVAWHDLTHTSMPMPSAAYDARARDIHAVVGHTADRGRNADRLCWAAHRTLLHIIVDELQCETELFSDVMNTFSRFKRRRTLRTHPAFRTHGGLEQDGLDIAAYEGSVYANPPYDGVTILRSMSIARERARRPGFRGIYLIPMTPDRLERFKMEERHGKVLAEFPNGTMPFIHSDYWKGDSQRNDGRRGYYVQPDTTVVLVMFESEDLGPLAPIDMCRFKTRVAAWHRSVMPRQLRIEETYTATGLGEGCYREPTLPEAWKLWKPIAERREEGVGYPGAIIDAYSMHDTPVKDVVHWDNDLALMGVLPDTFHMFMRKIGHSNAAAKTRTRELVTLMWRHLRTMYYSYASFVKRGRRAELELAPQRAQENRPIRRRGRQTKAERDACERQKEARRKGKAAETCRRIRDASESEEDRGDGDIEQPVVGPAGANQGEAGPSGLCASTRGYIRGGK